MDQKVTFRNFDVANYLRDEADIAAYLEEAAAEAAAENDPTALAQALGAVARAHTMRRLARDTGLSREGLYRALSPGGNPSLDTLMKVARALGVELSFRVKVRRPAATAPRKAKAKPTRRKPKAKGPARAPSRSRRTA